MHLYEAHAAVVINGHVSKLPAYAIDRVALVARDAVAGPLNAPELIGVHVQHGARRIVLIAHGRRRRLKRLEAGEAQPGQSAADGGQAAPDHSGDAAHGRATASQLTVGALLWAGQPPPYRRNMNPSNIASPATSVPSAEPRTSAPFQPLTLRGLTLRNRLVISPMCQYSALDGCATDWHLLHIASMMTSGAGAFILEATAVEPHGRCTPECLGLWNDANEHGHSLADGHR